MRPREKPGPRAAEPRAAEPRAAEPRAAEPRAAEPSEPSEPPEPSQLVWLVLQLERRLARVEHELGLLALAEEPEAGGEER